MNLGTWALIAALLLATGFGLWRAARDGRFRGARSPGRSDAAGGSGAEDRSERQVLPELAALPGLGERATLLQFSSAFCTPCRATRRVLAEVADLVPGVTHVEVDAEERLELTRRLGVLRTPTTLVLDADGRELSRAGGAPSRDNVLATLGQLLEP